MASKLLERRAKTRLWPGEREHRDAAIRRRAEMHRNDKLATARRCPEFPKREFINKAAILKRDSSDHITVLFRTTMGI